MFRYSAPGFPGKAQDCLQRRAERDSGWAVERDPATDSKRLRRTIAAGPIAQILSVKGRPIGYGGRALVAAFPALRR
jgi:hypothetical protein